MRSWILPILQVVNQNKESSLKPNKPFMFSVFNANLLTDMGKTIVRKHLNTTDVQAVWQELSDLHPRESQRKDNSPNMSPTLF